MTTRAGGWLHAAFASDADALEALRWLAEDGVTAEDIEIRSSTPLGHGFVPTGAKIATFVPRHAVIGGLLGGTAFFFMVKLTSEAQALPTGGMPIFPLPTTGVITFEGIAIGAIVLTVATILYECRLPRRSTPGPLDHYLADDHVLVAVRCSEGTPTAWASKAVETGRS